MRRIYVAMFKNSRREQSFGFVRMYTAVGGFTGVISIQVTW